MARTLADIEKEILNLSETDRATLAKHLIETLDMDMNENVEQVWLQEAEKRYEQYKSGKLQALPAQDALQEARNSLQ